MKQPKQSGECKHDWEHLYLFKTQTGQKMIQQRCKKCKATRYIDADDENTDSSK